jgi:hypothetical protein
MWSLRLLRCFLLRVRFAIRASCQRGTCHPAIAWAAQAVVIGRPWLLPLTCMCVCCWQGEFKTVKMYRQNIYGCTGELLQKRLARDPFAIGPPHHSRCPALKGLLSWCSATELFPGSVPW